MVVASRYMAGGSTGSLASQRVRISRIASRLSGVICKGLTDPMSGFFVVRRAFLERVVRRLYGRGFKILLDLIAAARGDVRIVELPYRMRSREHGESKLGLRVIAEFFMLLLYHLTGRLLPARFFLFAAVGMTGLGVHLAVLWASFRFAHTGFFASQFVATLAAMTSNFFDEYQRLLKDFPPERAEAEAGVPASLVRRVACDYARADRAQLCWTLGITEHHNAVDNVLSLINLALAEWLYLKSFAYWAAGLIGALVAALWNFFTTASWTWGRARQAVR